MKTYFGDKTVVILSVDDFKEEIRFGYGVDILLIPANKEISREMFSHIECELVTLKARQGEVIYYTENKPWWWNRKTHLRLTRSRRKQE